MNRYLSLLTNETTMAESRQAKLSKLFEKNLSNYGNQILTFLELKMGIFRSIFFVVSILFLVVKSGECNELTEEKAPISRASVNRTARLTSNKSRISSLTRHENASYVPDMHPYEIMHSRRGRQHIIFLIHIYQIICMKYVLPCKLYKKIWTRTSINTFS